MTPARDAALAQVRRVRVGSTNGPKLDAVRAAFGSFAPDATIEGVAVESGVSEQPVGYEEIIRGARNRAARASADVDCDFGVGIEDGLIEVTGLGNGVTHLNVGCAAVTDGTRTSIGFSSGFAYPPECSEPAVSDREPIGNLFDRFWRDRRGGSEPTTPSARTTGNIGKLSDGALPRSEYARHGVLCALVAFLQPDLYEHSRSQT